MIVDFTSSQQATMDAFEGWRGYMDQQPNVERISEGHYWNSFIVNMLLRDDIEPFYRSERTKTQMRALFDVLDDQLLTQEQKDTKSEQLRKLISELLEGPQDYGVCDTPEQVVEAWPSLLTEQNRFVILFREINRQDCPDWRWHKNGRYIGIQNSQYEHLNDENESIQKVLTFSILHLK